MYVYAQRVQRMIDMAEQLVHTPEKSEEFSKLYSRLEKYEEISDRMEIEIANYLNRCAEGRLSNEGKLHIASMLNIVSEIESIADCCFGCAKILIRKHENGVTFNDMIYENVDTMFGYVKAVSYTHLDVYKRQFHHHRQRPKTKHRQPRRNHHPKHGNARRDLRAKCRNTLTSTLLSAARHESVSIPD